MKRLLFLLIVLASFASVQAASTDAACAPNCYVATNGNDGTGTGTIASPWLTLVKCFNEVHAGGTCWFRGGTYEAPDTSSDTGADNGYGGWTLGVPPGAAYQVVAGRTSTGGSSGNPVTIRAHPGETVIFAQESGNVCRDLLNMFDVIKYVQFLDITFRSGRTFFSSGCTDITFERCVFKARPSSHAGDNPAMLFSGSGATPNVTGVVIRNNLFIADNTDSLPCGIIDDGQTLAFMDMYSLSGTLIEHNDFVINSDAAATLMRTLMGFKLSSTGMTIQNNYLANLSTIDIEKGIWLGDYASSAGLNVARFNILVDVGFHAESYTAVGNHDDSMYNNTVYGTGTSSNVNSNISCWETLGNSNEAVKNNSWFNNICVAGPTSGQQYLNFGDWGNGNAANNVQVQTYVDYNIYWKKGGGTSVRNFRDLGVQYSDATNSLTAWRNHVAAGGTVQGDEANSRIVDPGFVNPAAFNFSLVVGAAARTGGRGGAFPTYLGADDPNSTTDYVGCSFDPRCHAFTGTPDTTQPTVPANLQASAFSATQINLTWTASTDNVSVLQYRIERCAGAGCSNFVEFTTTPATSLNNTGLTPLTLYRYRVRAEDTSNNLSGYSGLAEATTPTSAICGNNIIDAGEACDTNTFPSNSDTCPELDASFCSGTPTCASNCQSILTTACVACPGKTARAMRLSGGKVQ